MPEKWWSGKKHPPTFWVQSVFWVLAILMFTTPALAHGVLVFAYAQGDTIHTESKFIPDSPVRQGEIQVLEQKTGKVLLTAQTDDQGKFSFKIPAVAAAQKMDLAIVVDAAMGHRGEWLLKADSYLTGVRPGKTATPPASAPLSASTLAAPGTAAGVDGQMLEKIVNKALESQLAPIKEMLTPLTSHRTSLPDIIGGIGYILGFFGLWAYLQSKRKNNS